MTIELAASGDFGVAQAQSPVGPLYPLVARFDL